MPSLEEIQAEKARRSLRAFVEQAWHVLEPSTPFVPGWHIDAICEHLEAVTNGEIFDLLINIPPRHAKSLLLVFWQAWRWITKPGLRYLCSSYAQTLSNRDSLRCRRLIESPWYQSRYGHIYQLAGDQNAKIRFDNTALGYRIATSVGGIGTGEGADIISCDDPHNVTEAPSALVRKSTIDWWSQTMSTRGNDPKTVARVIVMQRVHEEDLSQWAIDHGYEHLCMPAEYEGTKYRTSIGWEDPRTQDGELLWSEQFGRDEIEKLKESLGSYGAAAQLQQRPAPLEGGIIKRHWWRFWKPKGVDLPPVRVKLATGELVECPVVERPPAMSQEIQSWDMAFKDTKASAYVAGGVWGRLGANKYLLDQVREKLSFTETLRAVRDLTKAHPRAVTKLVEDKANGPAVISTLKDEIPGLIAVQPEGDKEGRLLAVSPMIESGNVFLPHPALFPWVDDFINEFANFPNSIYKDQIDQTSQALRRLEKLSDSQAAVGGERPGGKFVPR